MARKVRMASFHKAVHCGFCSLCALFARHRSKLGVLVNKLFVTWVRSPIMYVLEIMCYCLISALDSVFLKMRTRGRSLAMKLGDSST